MASYINGNPLLNFKASLDLQENGILLGSQTWIGLLVKKPVALLAHTSPYPLEDQLHGPVNGKLSSCNPPPSENISPCPTERTSPFIYDCASSTNCLTKDLLVPLHCLATLVLDNLKKASTLTPHDIHLHCNNVGAIKLVKNPIFHARTKHIEISHRFVKERVLNGEISLSYILTNDQPTDILTKPLGKLKFI